MDVLLYNGLYLTLGAVAPEYGSVRHQVYSYVKQYIPKGTLTNRRGPEGLTQKLSASIYTYVLYASIVYLKDMAALFSKLRAWNMGLHLGYYMLCRRTTLGVTHPEANNGMFLDKQRFPVVHRGANGCFYWSQVYVMC